MAACSVRWHHLTTLESWTFYTVRVVRTVRVTGVRKEGTRGYLGKRREVRDGALTFMFIWFSMIWKSSPGWGILPASILDHTWPGAR